MDQISYSLKRAFRLSAEVGFSVMGEFGLTPSRWEVLLVMDRARGRAWPQSALRKHLGVNRTTVSRFLKALEASGLIRRFEHPLDGRTRSVCLTEEGQQIIREVRKNLFELGLGQLTSDAMCFVTSERREERQERCAYANRGARLPKPLEPTRQNLVRVLRPLDLIREALGDESTVLYPSRRRCRRAAPLFSVLTMMTGTRTQPAGSQWPSTSP